MTQSGKAAGRTSLRREPKLIGAESIRRRSLQDGKERAGHSRQSRACVQGGELRKRMAGWGRERGHVAGSRDGGRGSKSGQDPDGEGPFVHTHPLSLS